MNDLLQLALAEREKRKQNKEGTSLLEQGMSGFNEGLADLVGAPVDLMTSGVNLGIAGVNKAAGTNIPSIDKPVGGGDSIRSGIDFAISEASPQNVSQRYARRVGREVGFGAPIAAATGGSSTIPHLLKLMGLNATADTAAGIAGQTSREFAPENDTLDAVVSMLAGGGAAAGTYKASKKAPEGIITSTDELFDQAGHVREQARASGTKLTDDAQSTFFSKLDGRLATERASPRRHPKAFASVEDVKGFPHESIADLEDTRAIFGRDVASNADESAIGMALKQETEEYLNNLTPSQVVGGDDPAKAVADLQESRRLAHQGYKSAAVEGKTLRGQSRAATSGVGGNEVNAMRQNVRGLYDNEVAPLKAGRRNGYTPEEIKKMEEIVFGTKGLNTARWLSRFSPTAGAVQGMLGAAGGTAALMQGANNPLFALAAAPGLAGLAGKSIAERGTRKQIDDLLELIRNGGRNVKPQASKLGKDALLAQILGSTDAIEAK